MNNLLFECRNLAVENCDVSLIASPPTVAYPGVYEQADGNMWREWVYTIPGIINENKILTRLNGCSAGVNSFTIDYLGNIYDCQLKQSRQQLPTFQEFMRCAYDLFVDGQIMLRNSTIDWNKFYKVICSEFCPVVSSINDLDSYILLWGNGAVDRVMKETEEAN